MIGLTFISSLWDVITIATTILDTRYFVKLIHILIIWIERGAIPFKEIHREWATPAHEIIQLCNPQVLLRSASCQANG